VLQLAALLFIIIIIRGRLQPPARRSASGAAPATGACEGKFHNETSWRIYLYNPPG